MRDAVEAALDALDAGRLRVAEKTDGGWQVHQWLKKAVLLSFRLNDMGRSRAGRAAPLVGQGAVEVRRLGRGASSRAAGFRAVPGCVVRHSAYIAPDVVLMPCFVNLGAHVASGTMIDTWATVGTCAQIGRNVPHLGRRRASAACSSRCRRRR